MKTDDELLVDILRYAQLAVKRTKGRKEADLSADEDFQSLLVHPLLVIGEAVKNLSLEFQEQVPSIPWEKIARMRDRLIHAYDRVDWSIVWNAVTNELPKLISDLESKGITE